MTRRILHVIDPGPFGGRESAVRALATAQLWGGLRPAVAAVLERAQGGGDLVSGLETAGVPCFRIELRPRAYLEERARIRELLDTIRPHVVHTHGYRPDVVDAGPCRRAGIPVVSTVHGFTGGGLRNRFYEHLQRTALRGMDAVVAVSHPLAEHLAARGVPRSRLHTIPNAWIPGNGGLDRARARAALGAPDDAFHIGWVGRLSREKGPDLFLDALARLRDLPWRASLIGDGPEAPALRARAEAWGLGDRVAWHGRVTAAERLFAGFDLFALTSRREGTPMVLFEAMEAGTPILATAVGGVPDVLDSSIAFLVPQPDADAVASAIREAYSRPEARVERACRARARLRDRFSWEAWVARYERVYERAAESAETGARR